MSTHSNDASSVDPSTAATGYRPPTVTRLGALDELTLQKEVGAADGATYAGLDIGSV